MPCRATDETYTPRITASIANLKVIRKDGQGPESYIFGSAFFTAIGRFLKEIGTPRDQFGIQHRIGLPPEKWSSLK